jgi:predicted ABC-type ATPase
LNENVSFAFETTLASKTYKSTIVKAQEAGYNVTLLFFWLQTVELAKKRVQKRVSEGGHNIEQEVIERRYMAGIRNLFDIYLPIVNSVFIYDNSEGKHELIAEKYGNSSVVIINKQKYSNFIKYYDKSGKN